MTDSPQEDLLGYALGALDQEQAARIEQVLANNDEARRQLAAIDRAIAPLKTIQQEYDPPKGLAARTCRFVLGRQSTGKFEYPAKAAALVGTVRRLEPTKMHPTELVSVAPSRFYWQDLLVAAGVVVAACLLLFPAIHATRVQARMLACQNNLGELGTALTHFSERHGGYFPKVPAKGNLAVASAYAPILADNKLLSEDRKVVCPGSLLAESGSFRIPTLKEIHEVTSPETLRQMQQTMGGSYGYSLGYQDKGQYRATKNLRRQNFAIASDAPNELIPTRMPENHGRLGQNVLFEDGHVRFTTTPRLANTNSDHFFLNDDGQVAAGIHANDAVIGAGATPPIQNVDR